eukprot:325803-Chlamydomonas_euryale.AAC.5
MDVACVQQLVCSGNHQACSMRAACQHGKLACSMHAAVQGQSTSMHSACAQQCVDADDQLAGAQHVDCATHAQQCVDRLAGELHIESPSSRCSSSASTL